MKTQAPHINPDAETYDDDDWEAGTSVVSNEFNCVDWWRNTRADVRKKSFAIFEESGIFLATCQHHLVLLACDMIKSGEL